MASLRVPIEGWLTGGVQFAILVAAMVADAPALWPYALAAIAATSLVAWAASYRRYRAIRDLPTSRVASAAQGYVELFGRAAPLPGLPVRSRITGLPCCWYRYRVEAKNAKNEWSVEDSGVSSAHFLLVDATGQCVISPEGAEVAARADQWEKDDRRYTEWLLLPQGRLYALGEFATAGGAQAELDLKQDVGALLTAWKQDEKSLLMRFDVDGDGRIDLAEWRLARAQARREVQKEHAAIRMQDGVHILRRPADGRPFLLADRMPDGLARRYALWGAAHILIAIVAGAVAIAMAR